MPLLHLSKPSQTTSAVMSKIIFVTAWPVERSSKAKRNKPLPPVILSVCLFLSLRVFGAPRGAILRRERLKEKKHKGEKYREWCCQPLNRGQSLYLSTSPHVVFHFPARGTRESLQQHSQTPRCSIGEYLARRFPAFLFPVSEWWLRRVGVDKKVAKDYKKN